MSTFEMTPKQQAALEIDRNIAVSAGAGTGKTRVLVERYLKLLRSDSTLMPGNIVAITFTRKAAAEMRERIRREITAMLTSDTARIPRAMRLRYANILDQLPHAPISTIHGFAADILREFAIPAGLDPGFGILEDDVTRQPTRVAAVRAMRRIEKERPEIWKTVTLHFTYQALESHLSALAGKPETLPAIDRQLQISPDILTVYCDAFRDVDIPGWLAQFNSITGLTAAKQKKLDSLTEYLHHLDTLLKHARSTALSPEQNADMASGMERVLKGLKDELFTQKDEPRKSLFPGNAGDIGYDLQQKLGFLPELCRISAQCERYAHNALKALYPMAIVALEELDILRNNTAMLTYDDLERLTWKLLTQSGMAESAVRRLQKRYRYFMIDEFQDTNPMQWQMLKPLVTHANGQLLKDRLFIVGDPKQSIYGFRNADVTVFKQVRDVIVSDNRRNGTVFHGEHSSDGDIHIDRNFRSRKAILQFTDSVCGAVMTGGAEYDIEYEALEFGRDLSGNRPDDAGEIGLIIPEIRTETNDHRGDPAGPLNSGSGNAGASCGDEPWAALMADHIVQLAGTRHFNWSDIAIMFPRRTRLKTIIQHLKQSGIPFIVYKGTGFWQTPEVRDLTACVTWLADSQNRTALYTILRSPLFNLSDEALLILAQTWPEFPSFPRKHTLETILDMLSWPDTDSVLFAVHCLNTARNMAGIQPLAQVLETFLAETGGWGSWMAEDDYGQVTVNIEKFLDNVTQLDREGVAPLRETALYLSGKENMEDKEEEADLTGAGKNCVTLMTIHSAKGLEFPVVYLTDIEQQIRSDRGDLLLHVKHGAGLRLKRPNPAVSSCETTLYRTLRQEELDRELAERKRLMYVAFTRARDHLYLVHRPGKRCHIFDSDPGKNRMMDWIAAALKLDASSPQTGVLKIRLADGSNLPVKLITHLTPAKPSAGVFPNLADIQAHAETFSGQIRNMAEKTLDSEQVSVSETSMKDEDQIIRPIAPADESPDPDQSVAVTTIRDFLESPDEYYKKHILYMVDYFRDPDSDPSRDTARKLGNAYHRLMEMHPDLNDTAVAAAEGALDAELALLNPVDRNEVIERFRHMTTLTRQWPLHTGLSQNRGYHEVPFNIYLQNGIVNGIIDLLVDLDGHWHVVDYKTDRKPGNTAMDIWLEKQRNEHRFQMSVYALAVRDTAAGQNRSAGIGSSVTVIIFFADIGREIRYSFTHDDLNNLEICLNSTLKQMKDSVPTPAATARF